MLLLHAYDTKHKFSWLWGQTQSSGPLLGLAGRRFFKPNLRIIILNTYFDNIRLLKSLQVWVFFDDNFYKKKPEFIFTTISPQRFYVSATCICSQSNKRIASTIEILSI